MNVEIVANGIDHPEGVAWETFHTTGAITHYGEDLGPETGAAGGPTQDERAA